MSRKSREGRRNQKSNPKDVNFPQMSQMRKRMKQKIIPFLMWKIRIHKKKKEGEVSQEPIELWVTTTQLVRIP